MKKMVKGKGGIRGNGKKYQVVKVNKGNGEVHVGHTDKLLQDLFFPFRKQIS